MVAFSISDDDRTDDLRGRVAALVSSLFVGVPDEPDPQSVATERGSAKHDGADVSVATIALFHEFGGAGGRPPERSFIRSTIDRKRMKIERMVDASVGRVIDGKSSVRKEQIRLGNAIAIDIRRAIATRKIVQRIVPRAGRSKYKPALMDTEQMFDAIGWRVL